MLYTTWYLFLLYFFYGHWFVNGCTKPCGRDLGIPFDGTPGELNSITDVKDVEVGFSTIIEGESIRTGVTAIFPRGMEKSFQGLPCFANWFSLNGNGEMTGIHWLTESGFLTSPILITNTYSVGTCRDALIKWFLKKNNSNLIVNIDDIVLPVIAETYDGYLNDIAGFHVKDQHVFEALENARGGANSFIEEGNVGGGTGMITFGFKAGTGTSSRFIESLNYTVGVLVQSNFGRKKQMIIVGVPIGKELLNMEQNSTVPDKDAGSIIAVLATDAPLLPHQLKRLATRISLGIGKTGGTGADQSGDLFLAFSTAIISNSNSTIQSTEFLSNIEMNLLFEATIQCVEEAIVNTLVAAETMVGYNGHRVEAISHQQLIELLKKYNRLNDIRTR